MTRHSIYPTRGTSSPELGDRSPPRPRHAATRQAVLINAAFWNGRSVFITGHTGFKGSWLTLWLSQLGARVTGFALEAETSPNLFTLADVGNVCRSIIGDVREASDLRRALEQARPDVVFHLAAQPLVRRSYRDPIETYATNVMGTVHCLDAIRHVGTVQAAVIVTSDKCYENRGWEWAYREDEPMGGHDPYSNSKGCSELVTAAYRSSFFDGSPATCRIGSGRAGNVIGGGDWSEDRLIPDIVRSLEDKRSVEIRSPHATRPWQHVLEPLHGYIRLAEALCGEKGREFAAGWNFGPADEDCRPVSYVVERLVERWSGATWHLSAGTHPPEASFLKVDASRARSRLGWTPRLDLDTALAWTADWYKGVRDGADALSLCVSQIAAFERR